MAQALRQFPVDVVHSHALDFAVSGDAAGSGERGRGRFNCVSASQRASDRLPARHARRNFALCLGRICPEKGFEHALDAARLADIPLLIGGEVFPYPAHRRYFECLIQPRLGPRARFLGPVGWARKRRLLNAARCLLAPSLAAETSSLVAMEAIACGARNS